LRCKKKMAVLMLSIICFLLSLATAVLGEPSAQIDQAQMETQPAPEANQGMATDTTTEVDGNKETLVTPPSKAVVPPTPGTTGDSVTTDKPKSSPAGGKAAATTDAPPSPAGDKTPGKLVQPEPKPRPAPVKAVQPKPAPAPKVTQEKPKAAPAYDTGFVSRVIRGTSGLVSRARSWLGTRYVWGGSSSRGVDCSGLTRLLYKSEGVNLPHSAKQQFKMGKPVAKSSLLPGDLVFFNTMGPISHVGMYIGNGKFIHAANRRAGVRTDSLGSAYYSKRFAGARRYKSFG
jgi:peptidoglycan DL-endopeptidase CwlO